MDENMECPGGKDTVSKATFTEKVTFKWHDSYTKNEVKPKVGVSFILTI